jgi:hypothetical protein
LDDIIGTYEHYRLLGVPEQPLLDALLLGSYARLLTVDAGMMRGPHLDENMTREFYFRAIDDAYGGFARLAQLLDNYPECDYLGDQPYIVGCEVCNITAQVRAHAQERFRKTEERLQQRQWHRGYYDQPRSKKVLWELAHIALDTTNIREENDLESLITAYEEAMDLYRAP